MYQAMNRATELANGPDFALFNFANLKGDQGANSNSYEDHIKNNFDTFAYEIQDSEAPQSRSHVMDAVTLHKSR